MPFHLEFGVADFFIILDYTLRCSLKSQAEGNGTSYLHLLSEKQVFWIISERLLISSVIDPRKEKMQT